MLYINIHICVGLGPLWMILFYHMLHNSGGCKLLNITFLKLMNWLNPNWSLESPLPSFSFCMSIWNPRWPPLQDILLTHDYMGKYRNIFSETTELIEPKQYMDSPLQNNCFSFLWYSTWPPGPIMCSDWLKFQNSSSETNELTEPKLHRNDHWKVLYQVTVFFYVNLKSKMITYAGHSFNTVPYWKI
jgi:hypothetical protein